MNKARIKDASKILLKSTVVGVLLAMVLKYLKM